MTPKVTRRRPKLDDPHALIDAPAPAFAPAVPEEVPPIEEAVGDTDPRDRLTAALEAAEHAFKSLGLGVTATVAFPLESTNDKPRDLVYKKDGGSWHLYVVRGEHVTPLLRASVEDRVRAAHILPLLHHALIEESARVLRETEVACLAVQSFLADIEKWGRL